MKKLQEIHRNVPVTIHETFFLHVVPKNESFCFLIAHGGFVFAGW